MLLNLLNFFARKYLLSQNYLFLFSNYLGWQVILDNWDVFQFPYCCDTKSCSFVKITNYY